MAAQQDNQTNSKEGRGTLITCFVLFAIYFINVLLGKINISFNKNPACRECSRVSSATRGLHPADRCGFEARSGGKNAINSEKKE
jgi:hypothetical protein